LFKLISEHLELLLSLHMKPSYYSSNDTDE